MAVIRDALGSPIFDDVQSLNTLLSTLGATLELAITGQGCASIQVEGIGSMTLVFEATVDGTDYFSVFGVVPGTGAVATSTTTNGIWIFEVGAFTKFRVRVSVYTSGTVSVSAKASQGTTVVQLAAGSLSVPGTVTANQGTPAAGVDAWPVLVTTTADVKVKPGDSVNNAVRVNVVAGSAGGPSKVDDAAFSVGVDSVSPAGYLADETAPDSVDEGDVGIPRMSLNRIPYSEIRDGLGNERGMSVTASNAAKVDGSAVTQPVSDAGGSLTVDAPTATPVPVAVTTTADVLVKAGDSVNNAVRVNVVAGSSGGPSKTDDSAFSIGADAVAPAGYLADEVAPDSVDEGDVGIPRMSLNRVPYAQLRDAAGNERGANVSAANALKVDGSAVTQPVSFAGDVTVVGKAADGAAVAGFPVRVAGKDGGGLTQDIITDASGVLAVQDNGGSITVDGSVSVAGTVTTQDTASKVDDAAFTPAVDRVLMVGAEADETASDAVDEGDAGALRMTLNRGLHTNLRNAAGTEIATAAAPVRVDPTGTTAQPVTDNAGSLTVDGTVTGNQGTPAATASRWPVQITDGTDLALVTAAGEVNVLATAQPGVDIGDVTVNNAAGAAAVNVQDGGNSLTVDGSISITGAVDTELPAAVALADNTANPTVPGVGAFLMAFDGTNWDRVQTGAAAGGALKVDGSAVTQPVSAASLPLPTGASTLAGQTQPGVDIGDVTINNAAGAAAVNVQDGGNSLTVDGTVTANQGAAAAGTAGWPVIDGNVAAVTVAWTSATAVNATLDLPITNYATVAASFQKSGSITLGTIVFEVSDDGGTTWYSALAVRTATPASMPDNTYSLAATSQAWQANGSGFTHFRVRLGVVITGAGTATIRLQASAMVAETHAALTIDATTPVTVNPAQANTANPVWGESSVVPLSVDLSGRQRINVQQLGGTNVLNGGTVGSLAVGGQAAHDAVAAGNPDRLGAKANLNEPAAVSADGDITDLWADRLGRLVTLDGHANPEPPVTFNATASGDSTVIAAPGASLSLYIQKASVHNRAGTTRTVSLRDGTAGTTYWLALLASNGGGSLIDFGARGWKLTANTLLAANLDAAGNVQINITQYYIAA